MPIDAKRSKYFERLVEKIHDSAGGLGQRDRHDWIGCTESLIDGIGCLGKHRWRRSDWTIFSQAVDQESDRLLTVLFFEHPLYGDAGIDHDWRDSYQCRAGSSLAARMIGQDSPSGAPRSARMRAMRCRERSSAASPRRTSSSDRRRGRGISPPAPVRVVPAGVAAVTGSTDRKST